MKNFFLVQYWFIKNFLVAIFNKFSRGKTIPADKLLDAIVISTGGTASSAIMRHLKLFKKINDENNKDGYKHLPKFPFLENSNTKIIFIYGEYEKIYNSLKRRNFIQTQVAILGCPLCYLLRGALKRVFFDRCISKQINNFKNKKNVLCLKFEDIWENKKEIKTFLEIDSDNFIKNFPLKK